jgi:ABC-type Mn2+/Zn2+ transport system permease subunit
MLFVAILLNIAFVFVGLGLSFSLDLPSGPLYGGVRLDVL